MDGIATGFTQEDVVGLVLLEDVENDLGAPLDFAERFLFSEKVAVNHHAGLGGIAKMIFEEVGSGECLVEIIGETSWIEQERQFGFGEDLLGPDSENEPVIVGRGDSVASTEAAETECQNAGERFIPGASYEAVKKIVPLAARWENTLRATFAGPAAFGLAPRRIGNGGGFQLARDFFRLVEQFLDEEKISGGNF